MPTISIRHNEKDDTMSVSADIIWKNLTVWEQTNINGIIMYTTQVSEKTLALILGSGNEWREICTELLIEREKYNRDITAILSDN